MPWNKFNPKKTISRNVLRPGISGQTCAGRQLTVADFTDMGLSTPVGLFNLASTTNLGSGGNLTNKNSVVFTASGVDGSANSAALLTGSVSKSLYIADTGASDPFRIKTGSWGCWFKCSDSAAPLIFKYSAGGGRAYSLTTNNSFINSDINYSTGTGADLTTTGTTNVADNNWHFAVATWDGTRHSVYVDGKLEATKVAAAGAGGAMQGSSGPFNIGSWGADASNNAGDAYFGTIEEVFVTGDVLTEDQIRNLYAVKIAHGLPATPKASTVTVNRYSKGAPLAVTDFSATPLHLYNFTAGALTDAGSLNNTLTNNGSAVAVNGADGSASGGYFFKGSSSQYLSTTDAGCPSGTSARSFGGWIKLQMPSAQASMMDFGTENRLYFNSGGTINFYDGTTAMAGTIYSVDSNWHFVVMVIDPSAYDGLYHKLYIDGVTSFANSTAVKSVSLAGANKLTIGSNNLGGEYMTGSLDGIFITNYAMGPEEINSLYAKGANNLNNSPKALGDHVEKIDSANIYFIGDTLESQHKIDIDLRP